LALIPARGGSEGVPDKNIRPLAGRPLIAHSILSALASDLFDRVHVSTDDRETAEIASAYGAHVIERPPELAQPETPMAPVVSHALKRCEQAYGSRPESLFLLQPTSPLRDAEDIERAAALLERDDCNSVMGVHEVDDPPQWALRAGASEMLEPVADWNLYLARRQDLPPSYLDGPIYAIETDAFLATGRFLTDRTRFFVLPRLRAIDIDTEIDFLFAEFLLERGHARIGMRESAIAEPQMLSRT